MTVMFNQNQMIKKNRKSQWMLVCTGASLLLACLSAAADDRTTDDPEGGGLRLIVGAGAFSGPKYPGASVRKTEVVPLISASYGRYFIGGAPGTGVPLGVGAHLIEGVFEDSRWRLGVVLGPDLRKPRQASDDLRLTGLGDIAATTHLGVFGSYSQAWWGLRGNVVTDAGGKHQGTTASIEFEGRYSLSESLVLSAGPGLAWADQRHTQTFFGVDDTQAANSGLARYDTKAGLNALKFSVGLEYRIDPRWFVSARASVESLRGDAKRSPITSQASPHTIGVFAGYRF